MKYVRGEKDAMALPQNGMLSRGMKIPLINTSGNLIKEEIIMTLDGALVGGVAIKSPRDEKHREARIIPTMRIMGCIIFTPMINPMITGTNVINAPKMTEAMISPSMRV